MRSRRMLISPTAAFLAILFGLIVALSPPAPLVGQEAASANEVDPNRLPLGWWKMDAIEADRVADEGRGAHPGVLTGSPGLAPAVVGDGLSLDGSDDFAVVGDHPEYRITDSLSASVWARVPARDPESNPNPALLGKAGSYGLRLHSRTTRPQLVLHVPDAEEANSYGFVSCTAADALDAGWHHLAATYSRSSRQMRLFVDGVVVRECKLHGGEGRITTRTHPLEIGHWSPNGDALVRGVVDDIRLWDRALSIAEVDAVFRGEGAGPAPLAARDLTTQAQGSGIALTWSHDSEPTPAGFVLERRNADSKGRYRVAAVLAGGERAYLDADLGAATGHVYRIRAFGSGGFAPFSDEAPTITDAVGEAPPPPLGWWTMDAIAAGMAPDSGTGAHDGALVGHPQPAPGFLGSGLSLDGEHDLVSMGDHADYRITDAVSISVWAEVLPRDPESLPNPALLAKAKGYALRLRSRTTRPELVLHIPDAQEADSNGYVSCTAADGLDARWHHLAATYSPRTREIRLYVDGERVRECEVHGGAGKITTKNTALEIGRWSPNGNSLLRGVVDDVRLWNRALRPREVFLGYVQGLLDAEPGPDVDRTPPTVPVAPSAAAISAAQVALSWEPSLDPMTPDEQTSGLAGYRLRRDGRLVATLGVVHSFVDRGLAPNTSYAYAVSAFDLAGNESEGAPTAVATPSPSSGRGSVGPAGGTVSTGDGSLRLRVPAGALAVPTTLALQEVDAPAWAIGRAFALDPSGTRFAVPALAEYRVELALSGQIAHRALLVTNASGWEPLRGQRFEAGGGLLNGSLRHFSTLALGPAQTLAGLHWYQRNELDSLPDASAPLGLRGWNVESVFSVDGNGLDVALAGALAARDDGLVNIVRIDFRSGQAVPYEDDELTAWANGFVETVNSFSDRAQIFIVGNEPTICEEGYVSAAEYARAFNHVYGRKSEMPADTILLAAGPNAFGLDFRGTDIPPLSRDTYPCGGPTSPPSQRSALDWLEAMAHDLTGVDGFALHTYGYADGGVPDCPTDPRLPCSRGDWAFDGGFRHYRDQIDRVVRGGWRSRPIYLTEFNTDTNGAADPDPITNYPDEFINYAFEEIRGYNAAAAEADMPPILALAWFVDRNDAQSPWTTFALSNAGGRLPVARADMKEEFLNEANRAVTPSSDVHPLCDGFDLHVPSCTDDRLVMCVGGEATLCEHGCIPQGAEAAFCAPDPAAHDVCPAGRATPPVGEFGAGGPKFGAAALPEEFGLQLPFDRGSTVRPLKTYGVTYGPNFWTVIPDADTSHCDANPACVACEPAYCDALAGNCPHCTHTVLHKRVAEAAKSDDYYALDLALTTDDNGRGSAVTAVARGEVVSAGWATAGGASFGQVVVLKHEASGRVFYSLYAHLESTAVSPASPPDPPRFVDKGEPVGTLGASTNGVLDDGSIVPHLHLAMYEATAENPVVFQDGVVYGGRAVVPEPIDTHTCLARHQVELNTLSAGDTPTPAVAPRWVIASTLWEQLDFQYDVGVGIAWESVPSADHYQIRFLEDPADESTRIGPLYSHSGEHATMYSIMVGDKDRDPIAQRAHCAQVRSVDAAGQESAWVDANRCITPANGVPVGVWYPQREIGALPDPQSPDFPTGATVRWTPAGTDAVVSFDVVLLRQGNAFVLGSFPVAAAIGLPGGSGARTHDFTGLVQGEAYCAAIFGETAGGATNRLEAGTTGTCFVLPPSLTAIPENVTLTRTGSQIVVEWDNPGLHPGPWEVELVRTTPVAKTIPTPLVTDTRLVHAEAEAGAGYCARVRARDGNLTSIWLPSPAVCLDATGALPAPAWVAVDARKTGPVTAMQLYWQPVAGADSYEIHMRPEGDLDNEDNPFFRATSAVTDRLIQLPLGSIPVLCPFVRAVDVNGGLSPWSSVGDTRCLDPDTPSDVLQGGVFSPTLQVLDGDSVRVSWFRTLSDGEYDLVLSLCDGPNVGAHQRFVGKLVDPGTGDFLYWEMDGLQPGLRYWARVAQFLGVIGTEFKNTGCGAPLP